MYFIGAVRHCQDFHHHPISEVRLEHQWASSQTQEHAYIHTYRRRNHSMDELPRHPTYDMDDSPAAGVKTRTRVRGKRASSSSKDNGQRPTTKRGYKKKG